MAQSDKIIYWPGIRRCPDELCFLRGYLQSNGFELTMLPIAYDKGEQPSSPSSEIAKWAIKHCSEGGTWWIGLSLGASIAHIVSSIMPIEIIPNRLTLINPFMDRVQLSKERGFDLNNQWPLIPFNHRSNVPLLDLVLSRNDAKINNSHGLKLKHSYLTKNINIHFINASHSIDTLPEQLALGRCILPVDSNGFHCSQI